MWQEGLLGNVLASGSRVGVVNMGFVTELARLLP